MRRVAFFAWFLISFDFMAVSVPAADDAVQIVEQHFQAGTLAAGETALEAVLKKSPGDDQARFALGTLQFVRSVEGLSQSLYRHGFLHGVGRVTPLLGADLPIPNNPDAAEIDHEQARRIVQSFVSGLGKAEATLAQIKSDSIKLPLHFGLIRMDFDGDNHAGDDETLWRIYARFNRQAGVVVLIRPLRIVAFRKMANVCNCYIRHGRFANCAPFPGAGGLG